MAETVFFASVSVLSVFSSYPHEYRQEEVYAHQRHQQSAYRPYGQRIPERFFCPYYERYETEYGGQYGQHYGCYLRIERFLVGVHSAHAACFAQVVVVVKDVYGGVDRNTAEQYHCGEASLVHAYVEKVERGEQAYKGYRYHHYYCNRLLERIEKYGTQEKYYHGDKSQYEILPCGFVPVPIIPVVFYGVSYGDCFLEFFDVLFQYFFARLGRTDIIVLKYQVVLLVGLCVRFAEPVLFLSWRTCHFIPYRVHVLDGVVQVPYVIGAALFRFDTYLFHVAFSLYGGDIGRTEH